MSERTTDENVSLIMGTALAMARAATQEDGSHAQILRDALELIDGGNEEALFNVALALSGLAASVVQGMSEALTLLGGRVTEQDLYDRFSLLLIEGEGD